MCVCSHTRVCVFHACCPSVLTRGLDDKSQESVLLPRCETWLLNIDQQSWWETPLPAEPYHHPILLKFIFLSCICGGCVCISAVRSGFRGCGCGYVCVCMCVWFCSKLRLGFSVVCFRNQLSKHHSVLHTVELLTDSCWWYVWSGSPRN